MASHRFLISEDDYVAAVRLHARPRGWQLVLLFGLAALCGVALVFGARALTTAALAGLVALAVMSALLYGVVVPWTARRHYRRYPAIRDEITLELTDAGLRVAAPSGESRLTWPQILKWREDDRFVLVYVMPILFHMVPKSLAQQGFDLEGLRSRLLEHKGPPV